MRRLKPHTPAGFAAYWTALLAVGLLTWAGVRATVMQAAEAAGAPTCGMASMGPHGSASKPDPAHKACAFCSAAAHAPLSADAPRLPVPMLAAWSPTAPVHQLGARGPPAFAPKARGPPLLA